MIEQQQTREYLSPESTGVIVGELVTAKACSINNKLCLSACSHCTIADLNVCFDPITHKRLKSAPACFGSDSENLSNKPLYYIKP